MGFTLERKLTVKEVDDCASTAPSDPKTDLEESDDDDSQSLTSFDSLENISLNPEAVPWFPAEMALNSMTFPMVSQETLNNWFDMECSAPPGLAPPESMEESVPPPPGLTALGTTNSEIKTQFNRTRLCTFHARGHCFHGEQCKYAHNNDQLQSVPDLTKTRLCFNFFRGECHNTNCSFAHGYHELRSTNNLFKTELCFQWSTSGRCKAGRNCRYAHGQKELRPPGL